MRGFTDHSRPSTLAASSEASDFRMFRIGTWLLGSAAVLLAGLLLTADRRHAVTSPAESDVTVEHPRELSPTSAPRPVPRFATMGESTTASEPDRSAVVARLLAGTHDGDDEERRERRRSDFVALAELDDGGAEGLGHVIAGLEADVIAAVEQTEADQEGNALGAQRALLTLIAAHLADAERQLDALAPSVRAARLGFGFEVARQLPLVLRRRLAAALTRATETEDLVARQ